MHLIPKDTANLVQWYVFEDDLNDSLTKDSEKHAAMEPAGKNKLNWMPSNGTYGLAAGADNAFKLPAVSLKDSENDNWQIVSRFKPLGEGEIFSIQFGSSDVTAVLSNKKSNLVLSFTSVSKISSETLKLPDTDDSFVAVSVKFIFQDGRLSAKLAFVKPNENFNSQKDPVVNPISVEAAIDKDFTITLGHRQKKPADNTQNAEAQDGNRGQRAPDAADQPAEAEVEGQLFTALWDELAILRFPAVKINNNKDTKTVNVKEVAAANIPNDESVLSK